MNRFIWLAPATVALAAATAGAWWLVQPAPTPANPAVPIPAAEAAPLRLARATGAQISMMEEEAGRACRCARRLPTTSPGRAACWAGFERNVARYEHQESSSMCLPLSTTITCFPDMDGRCLIKDYGGGACSLHEARTLEAIWAREARNDQPSWDRAGRHMNEAVQTFIRGESVRVPGHSSGGCSG
jgi:hypothetical protein